MEAKQRTQIDISLNALTGSEMSAGEPSLNIPIVIPLLANA